MGSVIEEELITSSSNNIFQNFKTKRMADEENTPQRGRGRPPKNSETGDGQKKPEPEKKAYVPTGRPRGRPRKNPQE